MANDKRFLAKNGLQAPNISFSSSNSAFANSITATFLETPSTVSFSGLSGQLFSITDSMTGSIYAVNDISGFPSIEVFANGQIDLAPYGGRVVFGNTVALQANGSVGTAGHTLHSNGSAIYWASDDQGVTSVVAANGLNGGTITSTGTLSVLGGSTLTVNTTGAHVNTDLALTSLTATSYVSVGNSTVNTYITGTQVQANQNDTLSVPAYSWSTDTTTGIYRPAASTIGVTIAGVHELSVNATTFAANSLNFTGIGTLAAGNTTITGFANVSTTLQVGGVATFAANANFDSGVLFVDGTNNRVGVNTTTPSTALDVVGMVRTSDQFQSNGGSRDLRMNDNFGSSVAAVGVVSNNPLMFFTNNTERVRVAANGNFGVGTSTPQYELDVNNGSSANSIQASFGSTFSAGLWSGIHFGYTEAANQSYRKSALVFERQDGAARGKIHILNNAQNGSDSAALADSRVTIQFDGNVGIANTAPGYKLDVTGDINFTSSLKFGGVSVIDNAGTDVYINSRVIRNNSSSTQDGMYIGYNNTGTTNGHLRFYANGTTERMFISAANGNVGIGTSSPGYRLEVNGSFAATTKSFVIDHPTKPDMKLRYGSLEGPENGVYVRGRLRAGETIIQLPDYWEGLVDQDTYTVNLTPVGKHQELFVRYIADDYIIVGGKEGEEIDCFYTVFAERKDVEKLVVEF